MGMDTAAKELGLKVEKIQTVIAAKTPSVHLLDQSRARCRKAAQHTAKVQSQLATLQEQVRQTEAELVKAKAEEAAALLAESETEARKKMHIEDVNVASGSVAHRCRLNCTATTFRVGKGRRTTYGRPAELGAFAASLGDDWHTYWSGLDAIGDGIIPCFYCSSAGNANRQPVLGGIPKCTASQPQPASSNPVAGKSMGKRWCGEWRRRHDVNAADHELTCWADLCEAAISIMQCACACAQSCLRMRATKALAYSTKVCWSGPLASSSLHGQDDSEEPLLAWPPAACYVASATTY